MRIARRIAATALLLFLVMMNAAQAELPFFVFSEGWNWDQVPVEVVLKADVDTHMPFDADRLALLTPITDMLSLRLVTGVDQGSVTIAFAQQDVLSLQYKGHEAQLSSMPDTTYVSAGDPMSDLLGSEVTVEGGYEALGLDPRGESLLMDGRTLLAQIPSAFEEYGKRSKTDINISGYGKSAYRVDYTITATKVDRVQGLLLSVCPDGWLREIISTLTFSGKQTLRIYYTADDVLLRAEYNGECGVADDIRTVKLVVRTRQDSEVEKDFWELTSPAKKGKNKNTLTFERTVQTNKQGHRVIEGNFSYTVSLNGITSIRKAEFDLRNAFTEEADVVTGSITFQHKLNDAERYTAVTLKPELTITGDAAAPIVNGTLAITEKYHEKTTEHAIITIALKAADALEWEERPNLVDLSAMTEGALASTRQQALSSLTTAIVHPLIVMMGEDATWFFKDLPEGAIQTLIETAEMPVE